MSALGRGRGLITIKLCASQHSAWVSAHQPIRSSIDEGLHSLPAPLLFSVTLEPANSPQLETRDAGYQPVWSRKSTLCISILHLASVTRARDRDGQGETNVPDRSHVGPFASLSPTTALPG